VNLGEASSRALNGNCLREKDIMTKIVLDTFLLEKLQHLEHPLDLCDDSGRVRAHVTVVYDPEEYGPLEPQVSEDELRRRQQSSEPRYNIDDVLRHLDEL
jgi:hypothetical protein